MDSFIYHLLTTNTIENIPKSLMIKERHLQYALLHSNNKTLLFLQKKYIPFNLLNIAIKHCSWQRCKFLIRNGCQVTNAMNQFKTKLERSVLCLWLKTTNWSEVANTLSFHVTENIICPPNPNFYIECLLFLKHKHIKEALNKFFYKHILTCVECYCVDEDVSTLYVC